MNRYFPDWSKSESCENSDTQTEIENFLSNEFENSQDQETKEKK